MEGQVVTESISDLERLRKELAEVDNMITQEWHKISSWRLGGHVGSRSIHLRRTVHSGMIGAAYGVFNLACFAAGVVMIVGHGVLRDLGIAIVVGSIFAFGSFVAQWWAVEAQDEIDVNDRVLRRTDKLEKLSQMRTAIIQRLDLPGESDQHMNR